MNRIGRVALVLVVILLMIGFIVGCFVLERRLNWKVAYEGYVVEKTSPLEKRIHDLETRIEKLERSR